VEELTKSFLESQTLRQGDARAAFTAPHTLAIPSSLQASLMARLDRLGAGKEVAQIGAVLGREFSYELLDAVAARSDGQLQHSLHQLVSAGLVLRRDLQPRASYIFKHALVQDAAYSTLLRGQRKELHARIANVLKEQFSEIVELQPETLAHHYTE